MNDVMRSVLGVNAVAAFGIGAFVYFAGRKRVQNALWFIYSIVFTLWSVCIYKSIEPGDPAFTLYWLRTSFVALAFLLILFLLWRD